MTCNRSAPNPKSETQPAFSSAMVAAQRQKISESNSFIGGFLQKPMLARMRARDGSGRVHGGSGEEGCKSYGILPLDCQKARAVPGAFRKGKSESIANLLMGLFVLLGGTA